MIGQYIDKLKGINDPETQAEYAKTVLMEKIIPHVGTDVESFGRKAYFIGYMARRILYGFLGKTD